MLSFWSAFCNATYFPGNGPMNSPILILPCGRFLFNAVCLAELRKYAFLVTPKTSITLVPITRCMDTAYLTRKPEMLKLMYPIGALPGKTSIDVYTNFIQAIASFLTGLGHVPKTVFLCYGNTHLSQHPRNSNANHSLHITESSMD